jgi:hypothetical protein
MYRWALLVGAASVGIVAGVSEACSQEMAVPVDIQSRLMPKILFYDRTFASRHHTNLVIGILYQHGYRRSVEVQSLMAAALRDLKATDGGLSITPVPIDIEVEGWDGLLVRSGAAVLYVAPLRAVDIRDLGSVCHGNGLLTFTGVGSYVSSGLAVGFDVNNDRPVIIINLEAARTAGADLSSQLLRVARVIE